MCEYTMPDSNSIKDAKVLLMKAHQSHCIYHYYCFYCMLLFGECQVKLEEI